jgi:hypothetical protein
MQENSRSYSWYRAIPRVFVGLVLVSTGIGKGLDMLGFVAILDGYQLQPHWASVFLAYTLPFIEFGIGISLLMAFRRVTTAWLAVGFHILMLSVVVITLMRGIELENCGCFGVFLARPLTPITAIEDVVMLVMSLLVLLDAKLRTCWG